MQGKRWGFLEKPQKLRNNPNLSRSHIYRVGFHYGICRPSQLLPYYQPQRMGHLYKCKYPLRQFRYSARSLSQRMRSFQSTSYYSRYPYLVIPPYLGYIATHKRASAVIVCKRHLRRRPTLSNSSSPNRLATCFVDCYLSSFNGF